MDVVPLGSQGAAGVRAGARLHGHERRGEGIVPIPGTTKVSRLEENAAAPDVVLRKDELDRLEPLGAQVVGVRH